MLMYDVDSLASFLDTVANTASLLAGLSLPPAESYPSS
jgi:hypothetical protein